MEAIELFFFLWLTVIGALIGLVGEILMLPGHLLRLIGEAIIDFGGRFE